MSAEELLQLRIRLQGARQAQQELLAAAAGVKAVGDASVVESRNLDRASRSGLVHSQMLYTIRRGAFYATTAILTLAGGAIKMGIAFDASMEQNRISLGYFLGSTKAANRELASLYQLAAKTPFQFSDVTDATRRFLAFGFTLKQSNSYLRTLGDTAAGLGLGSSDVSRLAIIIGQIKSSGRLLGQDTLQLAQAGINARGILQQQLHLTGQQMSALGAGTLTIPSSVAIPALMAGLQQQFHGMSALQAKTGVGLWSTAKDETSQFLGVLTGSLFERGKRNLASFNAVVSQATNVLMPRSLGGQGGSFMQALTVIDRGVGANGRLVESWREIRAAGQDVGLILRNAVIPAFGLLWTTLGLGSPPMKLLIGFLGLLAHHTTLLKVGLVGLTAWFVYTRAAMGLFKLATLATGIDLYKFTGITAEASASQQLFALNVYKSEIALTSAGRAAALFGGKLGALKRLGAIAIGVTLFETIVPSAPKTQLPTGLKRGTVSNPAWLYHVPVLGKLAGWGDWLGSKAFAPIGKVMDDLGLPAHKTPPIKPPATAKPTAAAAAALGKMLGTDRPIHIHLNVNGREIGDAIAHNPGATRTVSEAVFGYQAAVGGRA